MRIFRAANKTIDGRSEQQYRDNKVSGLLAQLVLDCEFKLQCIWMDHVLVTYCWVGLLVYVVGVIKYLSTLCI